MRITSFIKQQEKNYYNYERLRRIVLLYLPRFSWALLTIAMEMEIFNKLNCP